LKHDVYHNQSICLQIIQKVKPTRIPSIFRKVQTNNGKSTYPLHETKVETQPQPNSR